MTKRSASIKETGEELSPAEWERFDAAVAAAKSERRQVKGEEVSQAQCESDKNACTRSDS